MGPIPPKLPVSMSNPAAGFHPSILKIARASRKLAKHIHSQGYKHIIVSGYSNFISRRLFLTAWEALFPNAPKPRVHIFDAKGNELLYKNLDEAKAQNRLSLVQEYIDTELPDLNGLKGERICYLDEFSAKGEKYHSLRDIFGRLEFENMSFAFIFAREYTELGEDAFVAERDTSLLNSLYTLSQDMKIGFRAFSEMTPQQLKANFEKQFGLMLEAIKVLGRSPR